MTSAGSRADFDALEDPVALDQSGLATEVLTAQPVALSRPCRAVAHRLVIRVETAFQLTSHGADIAAEHPGNGPSALVIGVGRRDGAPLFTAEVLVSSVHRNILPRKWCGCCT